MSVRQGAVYAPVQNAVLYLTLRCHMRCSYCFQDHEPRRMSAETARKTVDFLLRQDISGVLNDVNITFFGGEPFLELDRMEEIVAHSRAFRPNQRRKRVHFSATTNGTIFSPRVEALVRNARMSLLVSLDGGPDASNHRPLASGRSTYALVARNLPRLASCARSVIVRMTWHPDQLDLVKNVEHALELGAPSVALSPVVEADWRGREERVEEAQQALADWFLATARKGVVPPLVVTNILLRQLYAERHGGTRPLKPCGIGTSLVGVDPEGHVMACHRALYRPQDWLGTLDGRLSPQRWKYVHLMSRDILGCDGCVARPVCGGGCRMVAVQAGGDLTSTHPAHCMLTRAIARATIRIYDTLRQEDPGALRRIVEGPPVTDAALTEFAMN